MRCIFLFVNILKPNSSSANIFLLLCDHIYLPPKTGFISRNVLKSDIVQGGPSIKEFDAHIAHHDIHNQQ